MNTKCTALDGSETSCYILLFTRVACKEDTMAEKRAKTDPKTIVAAGETTTTTETNTTTETTREGPFRMADEPDKPRLALPAPADGDVVNADDKADQEAADKEAKEKADKQAADKAQADKDAGAKRLADGGGAQPPQPGASQPSEPPPDDNVELEEPMPARDELPLVTFALLALVGLAGLGVGAYIVLT